MQPITLKLVIKGTIPSLKNNKIAKVNKAGKAYITTSHRYKQWYREMYPVIVDWMAAQVEKHPGLELPITQKVGFKVLFYFGDDKDRDLTNKLDSLQDLFKHTKLIRDDSYRILPVNADGKYVKGKMRTEVYLTLKSLKNDPALVKLYKMRDEARAKRYAKKLSLLPVFQFTPEELLQE